MQISKLPDRSENEEEDVADMLYGSLPRIGEVADLHAKRWGQKNYPLKNFKIV
jgi:hypothetical protein